MLERRWSDADRELVGIAIQEYVASAHPYTIEGAADAVLDALTAAGWRRVTGIVKFDYTLSTEEAERFRAEFERAIDRGTWAYEVHVSRLPWWRRMLRRRRG